MAAAAPARRTEVRFPTKMFVKIDRMDGSVFEVTQTVDISCHGARVISKRPWTLNEQLAVRSIRGNLYSRARVVHCRPQAFGTYVMGLELYYPSGDWTTPGNAGQEPPET